MNYENMKNSDEEVPDGDVPRMRRQSSDNLPCVTCEIVSGKLSSIVIVFVVAVVVDVVVVVVVVVVVDWQ